MAFDPKWIRGDDVVKRDGSNTLTNDWDAEDNTTSSTTSTTYQQKLRLTYNAPTATTYRIGWYAELQENTIGLFSSGTVLGRVQVDDTTTLSEVEVRSHLQDPWIPFSGFAYVDLKAASHNIDLDYRSGDGSTVEIRRARIEIWRV